MAEASEYHEVDKESRKTSKIEVEVLVMTSEMEVGSHAKIRCKQGCRELE